MEESSSYHVPEGMSELMACRYTIDSNDCHSQEVVFKNCEVAPGLDYRNILQDGELSTRSTPLFDIAGVSQQVAALNYESCCTSDFSGFASYHQSYAACYGSRSPDEGDSKLRPLVTLDESEDGLICSRLSSPGIPQPLADRDLEIPLETASNAANDDEIVLSPQGTDEAAVTGLVMEKIFRDHFHEISGPSSCSPSKTPASSCSGYNPSPTLCGIREPKNRSLMDTRTSSRRIERKMSQERSPYDRPDQSARIVSSEIPSVRPTFKRPLEVIRSVEFKANPKWNQQKVSRALGLNQGPYPSRCEPSCEDNRPKTTSVTEVERANSRTRCRRRTRISRGDSSTETQRMTHIAVERNRRKQMNDHLSALKALIPSTFVQKTDQASIIGSAVEFVKELEVLLESLLSKRRRRSYAGILGPIWNGFNFHRAPLLCAPYTGAASFAPPVPTTAATEDHTGRMASKRAIMSSELLAVLPEITRVTIELRAECRSPAATVEVKVLGKDAIVNITTHRRAKQLVKVIATLESLDLNIVHVNVTTSNSTVLYTFNAKVGPECRMTVNHIATTIQQTFNELDLFKYCMIDNREY